MAINRIEILLEANDKASGRIKELENRIKRFSVGAAAGTDKVKKSTDRLSNAFKSLGQVFIAAGLFRGFQAIVKTAVDFESAFAGVRKTVDATEKEFLQLSDAIIEMSKRMPVTAVELARIQELAGQLGISGVKDLTDFTEVIAKIGPTTDLSIEVASVSLARFADLSGDSVDNVDRLASALVGAGNKFRTFESNILELATRIAASGRLAGLTSAEILGIATAFSEAGIQAEAGGTAIAKVLTDLTADGRKGADEFGKFIKEISDAGDLGALKLEELGFGSDRLKRAFLSVAVQGDRFSTILNTLSKDYEENTALNTEFAKRQETTASKILVTRNNVAALSIGLSDKLLPALQNILISANFLVDKFDQLFGEREPPKDLENSLIKIIDLSFQQEKVQRSIIQTALGNASARAAAEERINEILIARTRAFNTLNELRFEQRPLEGPEEGPDGLEKLKEVSEEKIQTIATEVERVGALKSDALKKEIANINTELKQVKLTEKAKTKIIIAEGKIRDKTAEARLTLEKKLQDDAVTNGISALRILGQENKAAAVAFKAIQLGRAVINTAEGITDAFPNLALMALIAAAGAVQIGAIASTGFQSGTDSVPANLTPGEIVVPRSFADSIRAGRLTLGGADADGGRIGGDTTINIIIEGGINSEGQTAEGMAETLGFEVERALKSGGGF